MNPVKYVGLLSSLAVLLAAGLVPGCGPADEQEGPTPPGEEVKSDKQRVSSPQLPGGDFALQLKGNRALAVDLYQQLRARPGNLFYSPHSITLAMAMLYAGARNNTEKEMAKALHYDLPQARLHAAFNKLDQDLATRGQGKKSADGGKFRLNVVNATWGQQGYSFLTPYLDTLALNYGAGLRVLDFQSKPEDSRLKINKWVEDKTEKRIKDLLPQGSINGLTRLVLTNAIYFNAAWAEPFEAKDTAQGSFQLQGGGSVTAQMMYQQLKAPAMQGSGFKAVALPYDGHELSMVFVVPDKGSFASFEKGLTASLLDDVEAKLKGSMVKLKLPRFEFTKKADLKAVLEAMGIKDAFTEAADLSGIDGTKKLLVTGVFHKAFVKVNEEGTEAAAATGVVAGATSAPPPFSLTVDRPFLFYVRDHQTGAMLFVGRVLDPTL